MTTGKVKTLFINKEKTEALFPRTKLNAISDENGVGLDALMEHLAYTDEKSNDIIINTIDADSLNGVPAKDWAQKSFVTSEIAKAQLGGGSGSGDIDLSGFATKDDLSNIDFPVDSVNGKTGNVQLSAADIGARPNTWLPTIAEIGAAPAGYGLGGYTQLLNSANDLNTITGTGFFDWGSSAPANAPFTYAVMLQLHRTNGSVFQKVWQLGVSTDKQCSCERVVNDGQGEWEWVNPPMFLGVEYRTTERWLGMPVYCKAVNVEAFPTNGSSASIPYLDYSPRAVLRFVAHSGYILYPNRLYGKHIDVMDNKIYMESTDTPYDGGGVHVAVWYVKN